VQTLWMYFSHQARTGFSTVILLQLFIGSGLMLSLSVIGLYVGKIYEEIKGRPRYLIWEDTAQETLPTLRTGAREADEAARF